MGTYIRPSIKKDFVCCHPTQIFQVGRKEGQYACCVVFLYDYCCCLLFVFRGGGHRSFMDGLFILIFHCSNISLCTSITLFPGILISENIHKIVARLSTLHKIMRY